MNLDVIITEVADQADEILAGITVRKEARAALKEHLESNHNGLEPEVRSIVIGEVLHILEEEEFFATSPLEPETVWGDGEEPGTPPGP